MYSSESICSAYYTEAAASVMLTGLLNPLGVALSGVITKSKCACQHPQQQQQQQQQLQHLWTDATGTDDDTSQLGTCVQYSTFPPQPALAINSPKKNPPAQSEDSFAAHHRHTIRASKKYAPQLRSPEKKYQRAANNSFEGGGRLLPTLQLLAQLLLVLPSVQSAAHLRPVPFFGGGSYWWQQNARSMDVTMTHICHMVYDFARLCLINLRP